MAYDQTANALPAEIVRPDDPLLVSERVAVAAFLAGYSGSTREYSGWIAKNLAPCSSGRPHGPLLRGPHGQAVDEASGDRQEDLAPLLATFVHHRCS